MLANALEMQGADEKRLMPAKLFHQLLGPSIPKPKKLIKAPTLGRECNGFKSMRITQSLQSDRKAKKAANTLNFSSLPVELAFDSLFHSPGVPRWACSGCVQHAGN
jgi:hypothetical protein